MKGKLQSRYYQGSFLQVLYILVILQLVPSACMSKTDIPVKPGAWRIEKYYSLIESKEIALMVNNGSLVDNKNLADTLLSLGIDIVKVFTPEHGFAIDAENGASVSDGLYAGHDIPVISLYGNKRKPTIQDMEGIDILIFDLQDVGVRFFTYISSLHYIMEACAENNVSLIVLDRPNPNGHYMDGPVLEEEFRSFVGMHPVPVVYGMTIGEYARMINGEFWLSDSLTCPLTVIPIENYSHSDFYSLPVPPSPNLTNMAAIYLYPSICFFEGTIVSEGRGTEAPFQLIGHPDYSDRSISFKPESIPGASLNPKYKELICYGIDLRELPLDSLQNQRSINLRYLLEFYDDLGKKQDFFTDYFDVLAGTSELREQILKGYSAQEIHDRWQRDLEEFKKIRVKYLLYPDFE